jgi:hypothetical protein
VREGACREFERMRSSMGPAGRWRRAPPQHAGAPARAHADADGAAWCYATGAWPRHHRRDCWPVESLDAWGAAAEGCGGIDRIRWGCATRRLDVIPQAGIRGIRLSAQRSPPAEEPRPPA